MSNIQEYAESRLAETLSGKSGSEGDLKHEIETLDHDFDFDSFAPYRHEEDEVISELEKEYWQSLRIFLATKPTRQRNGKRQGEPTRVLLLIPRTHRFGNNPSKS